MFISNYCIKSIPLTNTKITLILAEQIPILIQVQYSTETIIYTQNYALTLPNALESLQSFTDNYGGSIKLLWEYPETLPEDWQVYVFKKNTVAPDDTDIADYFAGDLTNQQLAEKGLFVFRNIPTETDHITDMMVENGKEYFYKAVLYDKDEEEYSDILVTSTTPQANITWNVVDGKGTVVRAFEIMIDAIKSREGEKPVIERNIRVFRDHSSRKQEDFFVVVQRAPGNVVERYLSDIIASYKDAIVRGELDYDTLSVEWIAIGLPIRRDKFTDIVRVFRTILRHYIMKLGNGDIKDVRFIMSGDGEGQYAGEIAVIGRMTVVLIVEHQVQIGRVPAEWESIETVYKNIEDF